MRVAPIRTPRDAKGQRGRSGQGHTRRRSARALCQDTRCRRLLPFTRHYGSLPQILAGAHEVLRSVNGLLFGSSVLVIIAFQAKKHDRPCYKPRVVQCRTVAWRISPVPFLGLAAHGSTWAVTEASVLLGVVSMPKELGVGGQVVEVIVGKVVKVVVSHCRSICQRVCA